jgi:predicted DNA-binding transcriptional regulator
MRLCEYNRFNYIEAVPMVTLSDDEVALLRSLLIALRGIKVRDIDKALVILAKANRGAKP